MQHGSKLFAALERAGQLRGTSEMVRAGAGALAALLAAVLVAVLADAVIGFDSWALRIIDVALLAAVIVAIVSIVRAGLRNRYDPRRIARLLETSLGIGDSRLINAVELSGAAAAGSASLREMAIDLGDAAAAQVKPSSVIDRRALKHALIGAGCVVAVLLSSWAAMPRLFATVLPRYVSPGSDLPTFTLLQFNVGVDPQRIYFGKPANIHASLTSPFALPEIATAVFDVGDGRRERIAMIRSDTGQFVLAIDRAEQSRRFYIDTPQGRSDWQTLTVLPVPLFEKVTVRYDFPAYTGWPASEGPLDARGIKALVGTKVTITVDSNMQLGGLGVLDGRAGSTAYLSLPEETIRSSDQKPPTRDAFPRQLSVDFPIATTQYELSLTSVEGVHSETNLIVNAVAVPDAPPTVQLAQPDIRIMVPEGYTVPVAAVASDDIGVKEVVLHSRVNDRAVDPKLMSLNYRNPAYATAAASIYLPEINAKAGDTVRGFVTVFDNHPNPSQSVDSPTFEIAVITDEQYKELARQEYRIEQLTQEMEKLQEQKEKLDEARDKLIDQLEALKKKIDENKGEPSDADKKAMEQLLRDLDKYGKDSKAAAEQMKERAKQEQLYEFEKPYADLLDQTAKDLQQQSDSAQRNGEALGKKPSAENIEQALKDLAKDRDRRGDLGEQSKLTQEQLKKLEQADGLMQGTEQIVALAERQKELADKLSSYKEGEPLTAPERDRLQRLTQEQQEIQKELHDTMESLEKQAKDAKDSLPKMSQSVRDIVDKIRELNVEGDQQDAANHGLGNRGYESYEYANSAAKKLGMMIGECLECQGQASKDLDGALSLTKSKLEKAMQQMAQGRKGNRPGTKSGSSGRGSNGQTGTSAGGSSSSTGGENSGKSTLMGPRTPKSGGELGDKKHKTGTYNQPGVGPGFEDSRLPEQLDAGVRKDPSDIGAAGGVPMRYRSLAEQYFRRLAQDGQK